jgi:hypothetical protein
LSGQSHWRGLEWGVGGECWYELRDNGVAFFKYQTLQPDAWKKGIRILKTFFGYPWSFSQGSFRPFMSLNLSFNFKCPADAKRSLFFKYFSRIFFNFPAYFPQSFVDFLEIERRMAPCIVCTLYSCTQRVLNDL